MRLYNISKRSFDFIVSFIALLILSPLFLAISLWIKTNSRGPVFFRQRRIGKCKKCFNILKFRTMYCDTPDDIPTHMLDNPDSHITKPGHFLRRTSLDELPQLINVLKGEMSLVGPRPALWNQDDLVAERDKYGANDLKPGITGLAQVKGRDELPIPVKARYDGFYASHRGTMIDIKTLTLTTLAVLKAHGVKEGRE